MEQLFKKNLIVCGDCLETLQRYPDHFINLSIADPPYYIMNGTNIKFKTRTDIVQQADFDNFPSYETFIAFTKAWVTLLYHKLKENASLYCFFGAQYISDLLRICLDLGMVYKGIIVWHKLNPAPKVRKTGYLSSTELILFMVKGNPTFHFLGQNEMHNFIETPICQGLERFKTKNAKGESISLHPTQKPVVVIKKLITVSSNEWDVVCDPFAGAGTTNHACAMMQRYCLGIEKNAAYADAGQQRLKKLLRNQPLDVFAHKN